MLLFRQTKFGPWLLWLRLEHPLARTLGDGGGGSGMGRWMWLMSGWEW